MSVDAIRYDESKQWRPEDLLDIDDDRHRYEIARGVLEMSPSPTQRHNRVASRLIRVVEPQLPVELLCALEFGLVIGRSYREPDFGIVLDSELPSEDRIGIPPDEVLLLAEIASASSLARDRLVKAAEYAAAGVGVYLLLDQAAHQITVHLLDAATNTYRIEAVCGAGETVRLAQPVPLEVPVDAVFA